MIIAETINKNKVNVKMKGSYEEILEEYKYITKSMMEIIGGQNECQRHKQKSNNK